MASVFLSPSFYRPKTQFLSGYANTGRKELVVTSITKMATKPKLRSPKQNSGLVKKSMIQYQQENIYGKELPRMAETRRPLAETAQLPEGRT